MSFYRSQGEEYSAACSIIGCRTTHTNRQVVDGGMSKELSDVHVALSTDAAYTYFHRFEEPVPTFGVAERKAMLRNWAMDRVSGGSVQESELLVTTCGEIAELLSPVRGADDDLKWKWGNLTSAVKRLKKNQ